MANQTFDSAQYKEYMAQLKRMISELPPFCAEFFRGIENETLIRTRVAYAGDLKNFFGFLIKETENFKRDNIRSLTLSDIDRVSVTDVEIYLSYVTMYVDDDEREKVNQDRAKARKLSSIRALYKYFYKKEKLTHNAPSLVDLPTIRDRAIIRLEPNEVADLLDVVQNGDGLTDKQKAYHKKTQARDLAILTLFLGTGIRISELVGIDMDDINFTSNEFSIVRKGGKQDILVFGDEAREALLQYMLERERIQAAPGHEDALFLSLQKNAAHRPRS